MDSMDRRCASVILVMSLLTHSIATTFIQQIYVVATLSQCNVLAGLCRAAFSFVASVFWFAVFVNKSLFIPIVLYFNKCAVFCITQVSSTLENIISNLDSCAELQYHLLWLNVISKFYKRLDIRQHKWWCNNFQRNW